MKQTVMILVVLSCCHGARGEKHNLRRALQTRFEGNDTDDSIKGTGRFDIVYAGAGDDKVVAGGGGDVVYGQGGADVLLGNNGPDWLFGANGEDILRGGKGFDVLNGGDKDDKIYADKPAFVTSAGDPFSGDYIYGGKGADEIVLGPGFNRVFIGRAAEKEADADGIFDTIRKFVQQDPFASRQDGDLIMVHAPKGQQKHRLTGRGENLFVDNIKIAIVKGADVQALVDAGSARLYGRGYSTHTSTTTDTSTSTSTSNDDDGGGYFDDDTATSTYTTNDDATSGDDDAAADDDDSGGSGYDDDFSHTSYSSSVSVGDSGTEPNGSSGPPGSPKPAAATAPADVAGTEAGVGGVDMEEWQLRFAAVAAARAEMATATGGGK